MTQAPSSIDRELFWRMTNYSYAMSRIGSLCTSVNSIKPRHTPQDRSVDIRSLSRMSSLPTWLRSTDAANWDKTLKDTTNALVSLWDRTKADAGLESQALPKTGEYWDLLLMGTVAAIDQNADDDGFFDPDCENAMLSLAREAEEAAQQETEGLGGTRSPPRDFCA